MDARIQGEISNILDALEQFIEPATTEEELRAFLARSLGETWHDAALQTNALHGRVIYTATQLMSIGGKCFPMVFVVDRDSAGRFYVAAPSPIAGYE